MRKNTHKRILANVQDRGVGLETNKDIIHFFNGLIDQLKYSNELVNGEPRGFNYDELMDARTSVLSTHLSELANKGKSITDEELPIHNKTITGAIDDIGMCITTQPYWIDGDFFLENQRRDNNNTGTIPLLTLELVVPKRRESGSAGSIDIGTLRKMSQTFNKVTRIING